MNLFEAKKILKNAGYRLIEAYGDATPAQMAGMKQRLEQYIKTGSEFKIKSKANPLGLVVTVKKEDDVLVLYNANTMKELTWAKDMDEMIKKIYDIQANLGNIQNRESFELDLVKNVMEQLDRGQIVVLPDEFYSYDLFSKYQSEGDMVYLHGEAEDDAGYDICHILTNDGRRFTRDRRYDCVIANPEKGFIPSYMYFWHDPTYISRNMPYGLPRGLICYKSDTDACTDAQKKLDMREKEL